MRQKPVGHRGVPPPRWGFIFYPSFAGAVKMAGVVRTQPEKYKIMYYPIYPHRPQVVTIAPISV